MYKPYSSKIVLGVVSAVFAFMLALPLSAIAEEDNGANGETPAELLLDGMDAAADHASDSARKFFQRIIALYPASPEASRARRALAALDHDNDEEERAAIRADEAERTMQYRHAFLISVGDRVFFAENSATLGGRARSIIGNQARWLKVRPNLKVTVIGRADDGDDRHAAKTLSRERAEAVRDLLIKAGLDPARINVRAAGNEDRLAQCSTPLCRAENRNAEVFINDLRDREPRRSSIQRTDGSETSMVPSAAEAGVSSEMPQ
jgi:peptidoglycan-associated lipoprotein